MLRVATVARSRLAGAAKSLETIWHCHDANRMTRHFGMAGCQAKETRCQMDSRRGRFLVKGICCNVREGLRPDRDRLAQTRIRFTRCLATGHIPKRPATKSTDLGTHHHCEHLIRCNSCSDDGACCLRLAVPQRPGLARKTSEMARAVRAPQSRVDWDARDVQLADQVRKTALHLSETNFVPRIKLHHLHQKIPELKAKLFKLDRLPLTRTAIFEVVTSTSATYVS